MINVGSIFVSCCDNCNDVVPATSSMIAIASATLLLVRVFMGVYFLHHWICASMIFIIGPSLKPRGLRCRLMGISMTSRPPRVLRLPLTYRQVTAWRFLHGYCCEDIVRAPIEHDDRNNPARDRRNPELRRRNSRDQKPVNRLIRRYPQPRIDALSTQPSG